MLSLPVLDFSECLLAEDFAVLDLVVLVFPFPFVGVAFFPFLGDTATFLIFLDGDASFYKAFPFSVSTLSLL